MENDLKALERRLWQIHASVWFLGASLWFGLLAILLVLCA